jgi:succinoglycan biosynthesis protein ExoA
MATAVPPAAAATAQTPDVVGAAQGVDVSVLVPVRDEERHVAAAAASMREQRFAGTIEFLFIDGRSRDRTRSIVEELARRDPRIRLLDNPAGSTPHALNIGLRHARGEFVARMDAHTRYPPDYLALGVARLRAGDVASVSGPQIAEGIDTGSRRSALALQTPLGIGQAWFRRPADDEFEVDSGFTGLWRRSTLEALGGWDERWIIDQDFELAARIRERGGRIVCVPALAAGYIPRSTLRAVARQYFRYGFYRVRTSRHHPRSMRPSHLVPPALVVVIASSGLARLAPVRGAARAGLAVYGAALAGTTAHAVRRHGREAGGVPAVLAAMHLAYGSGFLTGCARFGVPVRAAAMAAARALRR